ncbi:MAG: histidinol-phosphate transaminase [Actinomycetota bacterium]
MAPTPTLPPGLVRPALAAVQPYEPGRPIDEVRRERGVESVVKLASNEGPFPPMPAALAAIAAAAVGQNLYPDAGAWELRDALSARHGVAPERILVGNGVDSLIKLVCAVALDPGDQLAMGWPSFPSWRQGAGVQGAEVVAAPLTPHGAYDLDALLAAVGPRTKLVVVVSPNNPTGSAVPRDALTDFLDRLPGHVLPCIDEAYFEYLPSGAHDAVSLARDGRPVAAFRTFSKAYGLAGLRIGYLVGPADLVREISRVRNAFDVNGLAQAAALASLADAAEHLPERLDLVVRERARAAGGLRALGLDPLPSDANFLLVPVGTPARAAALNEALLDRGVIVRPARAFGAPDALRVTVGLPEENDRMLAALAEALEEAAAAEPA